MRIKLYDGTRTPDFGKLLLDVLFELDDSLNPANKIKISPLPGKADLPGYRLITRCANQAKTGGKVNINTLVDILKKVPEVGMHNVVLLNNDLCANRVNWCFGVQTWSNTGLSFLIASDYRAKDKVHLKHILAHELGHMFGAPSDRRSNITSNLGTHCTNYGCVMQQQTTIESSLKYARERSGLPLYCPQCIEDMRYYHG